MPDQEAGAALRSRVNRSISNDTNTNATEIVSGAALLYRIILAGIFIGLILMMGRYFAYMPGHRTPDPVPPITAWLGYYLCLLAVLALHIGTALYAAWSRQRPLREGFWIENLPLGGFGLACGLVLPTIPVFASAWGSLFKQ